MFVPAPGSTFKAGRRKEGVAPSLSVLLIEKSKHFPNCLPPPMSIYIASSRRWCKAPTYLQRRLETYEAFPATKVVKQPCLMWDLKPQVFISGEKALLKDVGKPQDSCLQMVLRHGVGWVGGSLESEGLLVWKLEVWEGGDDLTIQWNLSALEIMQVMDGKNTTLSTGF